MAELTPMMRQYLALKEENPDALLFFRLGDFYEMFFEDAITASRELETTLTGRDCGLPERAPMCGVPWHAAGGLYGASGGQGLQGGHRRTDRGPGPDQDPGAPGGDRVVTQAPCQTRGAFHKKENRFIASVYFTGKRAGAALCDITTGEFYVQAFPEGEEALAGFLGLHTPKELITNDPDKLQALYPGYISHAAGDLPPPAGQGGPACAL